MEYTGVQDLSICLLVFTLTEFIRMGRCEDAHKVIIKGSTFKCQKGIFAMLLVQFERPSSLYVCEIFTFIT